MTEKMQAVFDLHKITLSNFDVELLSCAVSAVEGMIKKREVVGDNNLIKLSFMVSCTGVILFVKAGSREIELELTPVGDKNKYVDSYAGKKI